MSRGKLTLDDIADLSAYEREREEFRRQVIELKKVRRVPMGPIMSICFENAVTMRFQVQEMARAERILTDEGIQAELDVYNPLIPDPGELCATLFIELTSEDDLRRWLPQLVGIEQEVEFRLGGAPPTDTGATGGGSEVRRVVRAVADPAHQAALTRSDVTASVHYLRWRFDPEEIDLFENAPVVLATTHRAYREELELPEPTRSSLLEDLRYGG
jgi:hypothetical protein